MTGNAPFRRGVTLGLLAAALFGLTAPLVQRLGRGAGPFLTAGLLYTGAALVSLRQRLEPEDREAPLAGKDLVRIGLAAFCGAYLAPSLFAFGLQRSSGTAASLLLNLEAVFTALLAAWIFHEHLSLRAMVAIGSMAAGGAVVVLGRGISDSPSLFGLSAVALATFCWSLDNVILRPLADRAPSAVVRWKGLLGAGLCFVTALARSEPWVRGLPLLGLLLCGATGFGLSLKLYLLAQRRIGAARTGSIFATAPFIGSFAAFAMGQGALDARTWIAVIAFVVGVYLHVTEDHEHEHSHHEIEHEHAHRHDDGHHHHQHAAEIAFEHSHVHRHESENHAHPHAPDLHHQHRHK